MKILFIIAVLLAWPTYGVSLLVFVGLMIVRGVMLAKVRMHHADEAQARRDVAVGSGRLPSWLGDRDKVEEFVHGIERVAERDGVPILASAMILQNPKLQREVIELAGAMEAKGAPFIGQQMAAAQRLVELYSAQNERDLA